MRSRATYNFPLRFESALRRRNHSSVDVESSLTSGVPRDAPLTGDGGLGALVEDLCVLLIGLPALWLMSIRARVASW